MARTFLDPQLMTWEVYPSGGNFGFSVNPHLVFNCLDNRGERPRFLTVDGDEASAQKLVYDATDAHLVSMLASSRIVD
ncbi:MAG: hypothetical protein ACREMA_16245 [Longimicrobiales bacterium]